MQELEQQFKADGGTFEEYKIGALFSCRTGDVDVQRKHLNGKGQIYINSGVTNLGIIGRTDYPATIFPSNTITVDMFGNSYFRDFEYKMATHAHVFSLNFLPCSMTETVGLYICAQMNYFTNLFSFSNMCNWTKMKSMTISLPTFDGKISFSYMESVIRELQDERISLLNDYLKESGLENPELTQDEKVAVQKMRKDNVEWKEFIIGELFEPLKVGYIGEGKKIGSAKKYKTKEYCIPLTCAKIGDNGIMYWAKEGNFITYENTLSVIADGAVSAGLVYAQPEKAGAYSHSYFIKIKDKDIPFEVNIFLSTILTKVIYPQYSRERSPRWERICKEKILLPVTPDDEIDWDFMHNLITAESRLAIRSVVEWKNEIPMEESTSI